MAIKMPETGPDPNSEPNVVPMIDILLVLLIIFMIQIPLNRRAMDVQVPPDTRNQSSQSSGPSNNIVLELLRNGGYAINNDTVQYSRLDLRFHEIYDNRPAKVLFVKAARSRQYREVIEAMDIARGAGVQVIGFTPPDDDEGGE
jgi:biopolymer transport protein ExbD